MTAHEPYYEIRIKTGDPGQREILMYFAAQSGFEGFVEEPQELVAYIPASRFDEKTLQSLWEQTGINPVYSVKLIEQRNWNAEWEKQYPAVTIDDRIYIRAEFHPPAPGGLLEIRITPKMSFGTGHHETTELMLRLLADTDLDGKTLIDMGSGTGVLAILAEKTCAREIYAIDNDAWAYENMLENFEHNRCRKIQAFLGGAGILETLPAVDVFVANINRNIILRDMDAYMRKVKPGGRLMLSGFFAADLPAIRNRLPENIWHENRRLEKNAWIGIEFVRLGKKI